MAYQFETKIVKDKLNNSNGLLFFGKNRSISITLYVGEHWIHLQDNKHGKSVTLELQDIKAFPPMLNIVERMYVAVERNKRMWTMPAGVKLYKDPSASNWCASYKFRTTKSITIAKYQDAIWLHIQDNKKGKSVNLDLKDFKSLCSDAVQKGFQELYDDIVRENTSSRVPTPPPPPFDDDDDLPGPSTLAADDDTDEAKDEDGDDDEPLSLLKIKKKKLLF